MKLKQAALISLSEKVVLPYLATYVVPFAKLKKNLTLNLKLK